MKKSVEYAFEHPKETWPFVKQHAQAMEDSVMESHIKLYVNEFTRDLGKKGKEAISVLYKKAEENGVFKKVREDIFMD
jgi:1,4-dihydroxy-6-naphthoate synthase